MNQYRYVAKLALAIASVVFRSNLRRRCLVLFGATILIAGCAQPTTHFTGKTAELTDSQSRAKIHTELAVSYYQRGQLGVALEELNAAVSADANYGPAYNVLGLVYMDFKEDAIAEQHFRRALSIDPLDSDANNNYGLFLCKRKREQESIKYFLAALKNPLYATPEKSYVNAGVCSKQKGDEKSATEYFRKALVVDPNQPQALYQLAEYSFSRGEYQEAKGYLNKLIVLVPPSATLLWLGLRIEHKLGDKEAEANYAAQLKRRYPESEETKAMLSGRFE
jgi:type IV pilus assembly protein PilF